MYTSFVALVEVHLYVWDTLITKHFWVSQQKKVTAILKIEFLDAALKDPKKQFNNSGY